MTEETETPQDGGDKTPATIGEFERTRTTDEEPVKTEPPCEQIKDVMLQLAQKKNDLERGMRQIKRAKKSLPEHTELDRTVKKIKKDIDDIDQKIQETYTHYVMCGYDKQEPTEETQDES